MKEKYIKAEVEIVLIGQEDIITSSTPIDEDPWG